jgi:hypothetical protein
MESYKGLTQDERQKTYNDLWLQAEAFKALLDEELVFVFSRFCGAKEYLVPVLKKEWRDLLRFARMEKKLLQDDYESIYLFVGKFIALDWCPAENTELFEMRQWLYKKYTLEELSLIGKGYVESHIQSIL